MNQNPVTSQADLLLAAIRDYAIYMLSPEGVVVSWNAGAERFKGYRAEEITGQHFSRFYTPEDISAGLPATALRRAQEEGKFENEGWRVRKDGTRFWASVIIDPVFAPDGALLGFAKITRDITERKQAEESLEQARAQLFQAQKMEAVGQLTGGIAHDFNNLLSIISSAVQILAHQPHSARDAGIIDTIARAVDRGSTMTQQLLAFARQQPLSPAPHRVNDIISRFEPVLRRAIPSSIEFETALGHDVGWVLIDEPRLEAALLNLVVNARDALSDQGKVLLSSARVVIGSGAALAPGEYVRIAVKDNGSGMTPEVTARAAEPFFTTKEVGKGTGLGLSQVHGFIAQSGGNLTIDSAPGQGTTVELTLPLIAAPAGAPAPEKAAELVIIAEDEAELAALAATLFESIGYVALVARNGAEALRLLARHPDADLLFTDVVMPGMSGLDLARSASALYPRLKIMVASGHPVPAGSGAAAMGEFDFIAKPYRLSEIVRKLR